MRRSRFSFSSKKAKELGDSMIEHYIEEVNTLSFKTEEDYLQFLYDLDNPIKIEIVERDLEEENKRGIEMLKIKYDLQ